MTTVKNGIAQWWIVSRFTVITLACMLLAACEDSRKSSELGSRHDFGDNSSDVVVAFGDSITAGKYNDIPYPEHLATMIEKEVINSGVSGSVSSSGTDRIASVLMSTEPGFVVIMYGTNDAIHDYEVAQVIENLRAMVQACELNKSIPILCTLTPQTDWRIIFQDRVDDINAGIRTLAREEKVVLADVATAFIGRESLLIGEDNLHPNETGAFIIAETVAAVF